MLPFIQRVFDLEYAEKPDYDSLRFTLLKGLLDINQVPTRDYDWMSPSELRTGALRVFHQVSSESFDMLNVDELDALAREEEPANSLYTLD